jgi:2-hydroxyglutarate dehydrogenase
LSKLVASHNLIQVASYAVDLEVNHAVIGGGVIGLAIAARLAQEQTKFASEINTLVIEKNTELGQETSSRNSEVIHAGLYYPTNSKKQLFCIEGNRMLYPFCEKYKIPYKRIGKWIVAQNDEEGEYLQKMYDREKERDLYFLSLAEIKTGEPNVKAKYALCSPRTGIIDSHALMYVFQNMIQQDDKNQIITRSKVTDITYDGSYLITITDSKMEKTVVQAQTVINCAGLYAQHICDMLFKERIPNSYQTHYYKGQYFAYHHPKDGTPPVSRLIYPVPDKHLSKGLGVHATVDLSGRVRFGPDTIYLGDYYTAKLDYKVDPSYQQSFYNSIIQYLRADRIEQSRLHADYCGIRPKLQAPGKPIVDFIINEESSRGYPGFVNLLGIESPGLTCCMPIANYVANLLGMNKKNDFK